MDTPTIWELLSRPSRNWDEAPDIDDGEYAAVLRAVIDQAVEDLRSGHRYLREDARRFFEAGGGWDQWRFLVAGEGVSPGGGYASPRGVDNE